MTWSLIWIDTWSGCPEAAVENSGKTSGVTTQTAAAAGAQVSGLDANSRSADSNSEPFWRDHPPHHPDLDQPTIRAAHAELLRIAAVGETHAALDGAPA